MMYQGLIERYRHRLPRIDNTAIVSLSEGNTPLIRLRHWPLQWDTDIDVYVKYEGLNPTGSFKDRGMTVAVSEAVRRGSRALICASTGNTSASAAAYAARAGLSAFVIIPDGKIAFGKLAQAMIAGAKIIQIKGNFDQGMDLVKVLAKEFSLSLVNSVNPYRLQGQKTAAFEIIEALGQVPDYHFLPVGNAGNISAHWLGYGEAAGRNNSCLDRARELLGDRFRVGVARVNRCPVMVGYQAEGAAPIVRQHIVSQPDTIATAIRIGNPQSWSTANAAVQESHGWFGTCSDDEILVAQKQLASSEGIFCEPASAITIAGLAHSISAGRIPPGSCVVCTLTGHGLKDPNIVVDNHAQNVTSVAASFDDIRDIISANL